MRKISSWRTLLIGVITSFFAFVVFDQSPDLFPKWLESLATFAAAGGFIAFGIASKDANVTHSPNGTKRTAKKVK